MKKYAFLFTSLFCLLATAGCSKTTGVMPWTENYYSISADVDKTLFTKPSDAEQVAYREASAHCASLGQGIYVKEFIHVNSWWHYTVKLVFRCIPEGAPVPSALGGVKKVDVEML